MKPAKIVLSLIGGLLLKLAFRDGRGGEKAHQWGLDDVGSGGPGPGPPTKFPTPPAGWRVLKESEVTSSLRAKAVEVLRSSAPIGTMVPFTENGQQYGVWVTVHPGTVRAAELWRPADGDHIGFGIGS